MTLLKDQPAPTWSMARLRKHFGMIPAERILMDPPPGKARERDVLRMNDHCARLCELVDGVLVEKAMGTKESLLAGDILHAIKTYLDKHPLGEALPPDGFLRLFPGLVRAADVSFIPWERMPGEEFPEDPIAKLTLALAVEVISKGNTAKEMARKVREYFKGGAKLVWLVYPKTQTVAVYTSPKNVARLQPPQSLDGGDVLPGFSLSLTKLFGPRRKPRGR